MPCNTVHAETTVPSEPENGGDPWPDGPPVQLAPLMIDGGIKLSCTAAAADVTPQLYALMQAPRGQRSLPMPVGHPGQVAELRGESTLVVDVAGEAEIRIAVRDGAVQADLRLRAAALWADGYECAADRWIDTVSWWLLGARVGLDGARAFGWEIRFVPIAVDYHGLHFAVDDVERFVGLRKTQVHCSNGELRTLYAGGERSPVRWVLYSKTDEINARRSGDASFYAATWARAPGYEPDREIMRAELRLQGDGLVFVDRDTGEVIDLRDPATLADEAALAMVWAAAAAQRRLVLPGRSRKRRAATDPRWTAIADAAHRNPPRLRQAREVRGAACEVLQTARRRRAVRSIHSAAAVHGVVLDSPAAVGEFAGSLAQLEPREHLTARHRALAELQRKRASWGDSEAKGLRPSTIRERFTRRASRTR